MHNPAELPAPVEFTDWLDEEALEALHRAGPFPTTPEDNPLRDLSPDEIPF